MKRTDYHIRSSSFGRALCFAVLADLHGQSPSATLDILRREKPDYILMPGDIFELLDGTKDEKNENGFRLLREASRLAPILYSIGNHENGGTGSWKPNWQFKIGQEKPITAENREKIREHGAIILDDSFVQMDGIAFGGLTSGLSRDAHLPNTAWLSDFCRQNTARVLLCHHPEYYTRYLRDLPIDLIVSGHAHGGQWRIFGRGVFAPGQGIFPKYTSGVHDGRFVISTGLKRSAKIPRIFNEPEVVFVHIEPET